MKTFSIWISFLFLIGTTLSAQETSSFTKILQDFGNDSDLRAASVSFCAIDLSDGRVIGELNDGKARIPASMMKLSTAIASLETWGANHTFRTELLYSGVIDDQGVLQGDLYIVGSGDPSFGSSRLGPPPEKLVADFAEAIHEAGIREISGNVIVDESNFTPRVPGTWSWEDLTNYYAAIPQSINFMDNQFEVTFRTGAVGEPATLLSISPKVPGLLVTHEVVAANISNDQTFCFGHPQQNEIVVQGRLPANRSSYTIKGAIPQPGLYFASEVMLAARAKEIELSGEIEIRQKQPNVPQQNRQLIYTHTSPPLHQIVREMNRRSINLYAEALIAIMGLEKGEKNGPEAMNDFWQKILPDGGRGMIIKDGSGLSHYNTITARQLAEMLRFGYSGENRSWLLASLPVSGKSGSLYNFGKGTYLDGNLRAKSGYMTGNRGYAGFLKLQSGREIAFALMVNHYDISAVEMRRKIEKVLLTIAETQ